MFQGVEHIRNLEGEGNQIRFIPPPCPQRNVLHAIKRPHFLPVPPPQPLFPSDKSMVMSLLDCQKRMQKYD